MRELRLVAVNEDGSRLLLRGDAPEPEFTVRIDERLHAALRGDRARLGQLEIQMDSQLRPRDIQARVRAGESVESVAAAAGIPAERVMRYAGPVLAEREHVADRARRCAVRRPGGEGPAPLLEDTVTSHLEARGVDLESLAWDAWRREDGRWLVVTSWQVGGKPRAARWMFDPAGRSVSASDDEARWLAGERPPEEPAPAAPAQPTAARLAVVPDLAARADGATAAGDRTAVATDDPAAAASDEAPTGPVPRRRGEQSVPAGGPLDGPLERGDGRPADRRPGVLPAAASYGSPALLDEPAPETDAAGTQTDPGRLRLSDIARHVEDEVADAASGGGRSASSGRRSRASVPTWDEIMFGRRRRPD